MLLFMEPVLNSTSLISEVDPHDLKLSPVAIRPKAESRFSTCCKTDGRDPLTSLHDGTHAGSIWPSWDYSTVR